MERFLETNLVLEYFSVLGITLVDAGEAPTETRCPLPVGTRCPCPDTLKDPENTEIGTKSGND
jgi:hypothetical protein